MKYKQESELKLALGAFGAMARHNAYLTVMDIMKQLHVNQPPVQSLSGKDIDLEEAIYKAELFSPNAITPETQAKAMVLLRSHFPFLDLSAEFESGDDTAAGNSVLGKNCSYSDLQDLFLAAYSVLGFIRNMNLHYYTNDDKKTDPRYRQSEVMTGELLKDVLKAAPRKLKDRYKGTGLLDERSLTFFNKDQYVRDGKIYKNNPAWSFYPQRKPEADECAIPTKRLSLFGEILLVTLFLEKRYVHDFLSSCGLMANFAETSSDGRMPQQRIIRELMSLYSIRLPKRKLDISSDRTQVALDMLNELARCPLELYDVLPEGGNAKWTKSRFEVTSTDGTPVLMKRYSDRYVPLLLHYFDSSETFRDLRFQVNTGKLTYMLHGATEYMDGEARERIVQSDVNVFGRIQEAEAERTAGDKYLGFPLFAASEDEADTPMPYITDSSAKYVINDSIIGISTRGDFTPTIDRSEGKYKISCRQPDCWLSRNELPALAFYVYLTKRYRSKYEHKKDSALTSAEDIIKNAVERYRSFFSGVAEGRITSLVQTDIPSRDIPEKLLAYLGGKAKEDDFEAYKQSVIKAFVKDTKDRLLKLGQDRKVIGTKQNRIGKRSFVRIRPGKLADFLAEDIVRLQDAPSGQAHKKLTGKQYSILQGMIATFDEHLADSCRRAGLLEGPFAHPFLKGVFEKNAGNMLSTVDFYEAYLQERLSYFSQPIPDNAPFLHPDRVKWSSKDKSYYQALAMRYIKDAKTGQSTGIFLPRNLFLEPVRDIIRTCCPKTEIALAKAERVNMSFIIISYLENEHGGDLYQDFYSDPSRLNEYSFCKIVGKEKEQRGGWSRLVSILNSETEGNYKMALATEIGKVPSKVRIYAVEDNGTDELAERLHRAYHRMCNNEKTIRRYSIQDITMFLLAQGIFQKADGYLTLGDVGPEGNGVLDQIIDVETGYKGFVIRQKGIKIKNYGEIYKTLSDKRTESLFARALDKSHDKVLELDDINAELAEYDSERIPVVGAIQGYEKRIVSSHLDAFQSRQGKISFPDVLNEDTETPELKKQAIRHIRNAFSHNNYPYKKIIEKSGESMDLYGADIPEIAKEISQKAKDLTK